MAQLQKGEKVHEITNKIIMVGDSGTGKSSLLMRYTKNQFMQQYNVTVGVEFGIKRIPIDDKYQIKLQIWDTAGQQSFRAIVRSFYRNSSAVLLVYDITRQQTFESLGGWLQQARQHTPKNAIFVVMGTHLDLEQQRKVSKSRVQEWIKDENVALAFETSAKTAENISLAFEEITKQIFIKNLSEKKVKPEQQKDKMQLTEKSAPDNKLCC